MKDDDFGLRDVKFEKFLGHSCRNVQWACLTFRREAMARERDLNFVQISDS